MKFTEFCEQLEAKIVSSYEQGVSTQNAELLAGEFLSAMIRVSDELKIVDLDSRMRKAGVKAVKAALYLEVCAKADKKPTESALEHMIAVDKIVQREQDALDKAEVERDSIERYYNIFKEAHLYYRSISKGKFE